MTRLWDTDSRGKLIKAAAVHFAFYVGKRGQSREGLHAFALMRKLQIEGFVDGRLAPRRSCVCQKRRKTPSPSCRVALDVAGAAEVLADAGKPAPDDELKGLLRSFQQLSIIAETEINKAIQSCKRARGQHMEAMAGMPTSKQVFH